MQNRIPKEILEPIYDPTAPNATDLMCSEIVRSLSVFAKKDKRQVHGHINIHTDSPEGMNVLFHAFPNGDFFTWFIVNREFTLIALVNEKMKTLARMPVEQAQEFHDLVKQVATGIESIEGNSDKLPESEEEL